MTHKLANELLELKAEVKQFYAIKSVSDIKPSIELSEDMELPFVFTCEALHPGTYKGFTIEERDIVLAKDTIFQSEGNFHNFEINKDHKSARKEDSSVSDVVGKVTAADYDFSRQAYVLTGEIYDKEMAMRIANGLIKYVSLRINPGRVDTENGMRIARNLRFEELSLVRAPGDPNARIL